MAAPHARLAISASCRDYACVLEQADGTRAFDAGRDGLAAAVLRLFERCGVARHALRELCLDVGPGSYTGLRVALTFARTLHGVGGVGIETVTSLELIAHAAAEQLGARDGERLRVVLDARRARFHHAALETTARITLRSQPRATDRDELLAAVQPEETVVATPELEDDLRAAVEQRGARWLALPEDSEARAHALLAPRIERRAADVASLEPLYLMGSYAD